MIDHSYGIRYHHTNAHGLTVEEVDGEWLRLGLVIERAATHKYVIHGAR